jgi:AcrR family transcriptional regulator
MARPKKFQQTNLQDEIKAVAWRLIATQGAASLSLRAIARELHITAPAIYNYFPRRDDLVTQLIIDAFSSFGDSQLAARDALPESDLTGRMLAIGNAYRKWAVTNPQPYQLIFGASIPGYEPPVEKVLPAGARALSALVGVIEALRQAGCLKAEDVPQFMPGFKAEFEMWQKYGGPAHPLSLAVALLIWSRVHGLVSLEITGSLPPFGPNGDALYVYELQSIKHQFIKEQP